MTRLLLVAGLGLAALVVFASVATTPAWAITYTESWPAGCNGAYAQGASLVGCDLPWTATAGGGTVSNWTVASNAIGGTAGSFASAHEARLEADLATADHSVQSVVTVDGTETSMYVGFFIRYSASAETGYMARWICTTSCASSASVEFWWFNAGTPTQIGSSVTALFSSGATLKFQVVGSTLTAYVNGTLVRTATDTNIASGTRVGLYAIPSSAANPHYGALTASDVVAAAASTSNLPLMGIGR
jgi:hypothetical protein